MHRHNDALASGTRLEEFEIERALGTGSFGITYLARDVQLDRAVAVKEYLPVDWASRRYNGFVEPRTESCSDDYEWGLKRFLDEAAILARLDHPQIVQVYQVFRAQGTAYIVMEYLEGKSLADEIRASGPLSEERVLEVLLALADGLEAVHREGILHRDIKPANVILRDGDISPVFVDFGSARQHIGDRSRPLTAVLTPGYAPSSNMVQPTGRALGPTSTRLARLRTKR